VITADHGEEFGEHNLFKHGNSLYVQLLRVPLLIVHPAGVPQGRLVAEPVSLRHLAATALDLAGVRPEHPLPGRSLRRTWEEAGAPRLPIVSHVAGGRNVLPGDLIRFGPMNSVVVGRQHYIRLGNGKEEVYDLGADGMEEHDLAQTEAGARALPSLRALLAQSLSQEIAASTPSASAVRQ